uniref:Transmembrane protein n=1 Tax=Schistosoma japonicum TaxID=6182 RepID=Q5BVQ6_SCHJA|nr:unknown [Schistosoma japonicum]
MIHYLNLYYFQIIQQLKFHYSYQLLIVMYYNFYIIYDLDYF